jgi:hypothetical protein
MMMHPAEEAQRVKKTAVILVCLVVALFFVCV